LKSSKNVGDLDSKVKMSSIPMSAEDAKKPRVVVVGGGLAGCAAALAAYNQSIAMGVDVHVVLVDKMPKLGGNSAKASSGINALNVPGGDSEQLFESDTIKSGGGLSKPDLVHTLVSKSLDAIKFLEGYGVDLSKVTRLGGHSVPRSRTNPVGGNVGWSIMSVIIKKAKETPGITVLEGYKLTDVVMGAGGQVAGVQLVKQGADGAAAAEPEVLPAEAVILATGGFGANKAMLEKYSPESAGLATTNGPWATGDVVDLAPKWGAAMVDLEQVQVHPTGFVDPKDPGAGTKFLAPEKLRGVGGIMLNSAGKRFVDELSTRDKVSDALLAQPGKRAYLVLSEAMAKDYGMSAIGFYVSKSLFVKADDVSALASHIGVDEGVVSEALHAYNAAVAGQQADAFGKTAFPAGVNTNAPLYAAIITPVVHYCMGGVSIDARARALSSAGAPIPGLFAAGEVSGGVHGRNRLGGNSLLECAVFGTVAGSEAVGHVAAAKTHRL